MRILVVVHDFLPRHRAGTEVYAAGLARVLAREHEVRLFFTEARPGDRPGGVREGLHEGIPFVEVAHPQAPRSLEETHRDPLTTPAFRRELQRFRPEVVHFQHLQFHSTDLIAHARAAGARTVMTLHEYALLCIRGGRLLRPGGERCLRPEPDLCALCVSERGLALEGSGAAPPISPARRLAARLLPEALKAPLRRLLRPRTAEPTAAPNRGSAEPETARAVRDRLVAVGDALEQIDLLVAPSAFLRERFEDSGLVAPGKILVSRNGHEERGLGRRELLGSEAGRLEVGYVGTLAPFKGVGVLVEAMNLLGDEEGIRCDLHGSLDVDPIWSRSLVASSKNPRTVFRGGFEPSEAAAVFADIDVLVVPSLWFENAPMTIQEAFLCGIPVICSGIGGMAEMVEDGVSGLHVPPGDAVALAAALRRLAHEVGLLDRLRRGVPDVRGVEDDARALVARLEALVAAPRPSPPAPPASPEVSVVIPTKNGGPLFRRVLDRVLAQETSFDFEVVCIDSGSSDGTLDAIRARPRVRLLEIPPERFNHGATRNEAILASGGRFIALLSQDALPEDHAWLERLRSPFDDERVAGVYGRQKPRADADPFARRRLRGWAEAEQPRIQEIPEGRSWEDLTPRERLGIAAFDNVAAMIRRSDHEARPYEERRFGEDLAWGAAAVRAGRRLVLEPAAVVVHSHPSRVGADMRRVYLDHANLREVLGLRAIPHLAYALAAGAKASLLNVVEALRARAPLSRRLADALRAPALALTQNLAQWMGARAAERGYRGVWARIDRWVAGPR